MSITDVIIANKAGFIPGIRNLIPYPHYHTTRTTNGITFTDNGDGTVTANGTATASASYYLADNWTLKAGTYTFSGGVDGGSWSGYHIRITKSDNTYVTLYDTNGKTFTLSEDDTIKVLISVGNGVTVDNLTFKPMLELGKLAHDYMPYHFGGAEDSKKLGNKTAEQWQKEMIWAASHSSGNISTAGWYRVAKLSSDSFGRTGAYSSSCRLRIKKVASNGPGDYAEIHFLFTGSTYNFICTESQAADGSMCCSKIRYTYDGTSTGYLEVYYSENVANGVYFTLEGGVGGYWWKAITPELTSETVSGITVAKTYDIKPNVTPLNTGNMPKGTYTGNGASRAIYIYAQSSTYMLRAKGSTDFAIISPSGYIAKQGSSVVCGSVPCESYGTIQITQNYTSALFNTSGVTYEYLAL